MERRLAGIILLAVALTLGVGVPRLLTPAPVARASAVALPTPPPPGTCLRWDAAVVPCSQPHAAEVTATWDAAAAGRPRDVDDPRCGAAAFQYVALHLVGSAQVWRPAFGARSWVVHAPAAARVGDLGWAVCVVGPARAALSTGSVRDQGRVPRGRPAAFGVCVTGDGITVACDRPHRLEYLTDAVGFAKSLVDGREATRWRTGCADLAAELLATADPTAGGALTVEFLTVPADPRTGFDPPSSLVFAVCAASVTGDRDLVGSLYGLGGAALPLG